MRLLSTVAALWPLSVDPDPELRRSVAFLAVDVEAETILRASYGLASLCGLVSLAIAALFPPPIRLPATLSTAALAALAAHGGRAVPRALATARRVRSLGEAPDLVARIVLSMRLAPSPERAADFAARAGDGPLAASLLRHTRRARRTGSDPLDSFGSEWASWLPTLRRSLALVAAAGNIGSPDRERVLDDALEVILDGTRSRLRSFAETIQRPVTALYAFGVLLPTALIALLPAARAGGIGVTPATVIVLYDLLLPGGLVLAGGWLLARRPAAFPPPNVSHTHPDVDDRPAVVVAAGAGGAVLGWAVASWALPSWGGPIGALGVGSGLALLARYRPVLAVYDRIRSLEAELADALSVVGRRVAGGQAVETAIADASTELSGEMATLLAETARKQRQLQVGVREALAGDHGSLAPFPSPRLRGSLAFLAVAAREGKPAGSAILALADHVEDLRRVEARARHDLRSVCGTLRTTGAVFGPLVAGATVALAEGMTATAGVATLPGTGDPGPWLGLAVGWYVLALGAVLPALAVGLVRGLDRALVGARVGRSLLTATGVYLGSFLLVSGVA